MIEFSCKCGKRYQAPDESAGKPFVCQTCQQLTLIPSSNLDDPLLTAPLPSQRNHSGNSGILFAALGALSLLMVVGAVLGIYVASIRSDQSVVVADGDVDGNRQTHSSDSALGPSGPQGTSISPAECERVATEYVDLIAIGDVDAAQSLVDFRELLRRSTARIDAPPEFRRQFIDGAMTHSSKMTRDIASQVGNGGTYQFLRTRQIDGQTRVLLRLHSEEIGVNYHDLVFYRDVAGNVKIADIYIYSSGDFISQTMRRLYIPVVASENRSFLDRLVGKEHELVKHLDEFVELTESLNTNPQRAIEVYKQLPRTLQDDKFFLLARIQAAAQLSDDEYLSALRRMRKVLPNDPASKLVAIDVHTMAKEYDQALEMIDGLDRAVDGDAFLDALRAGVLFEKKDYQSAKSFAQQAIDGVPTSDFPYWTLIGVCLADKDFRGVLDGLKQIDQAFAMQWGDFTQVEGYQEFATSSEHEKWLAYLAEK